MLQNYYADCYVLLSSRRKEIVQGFINRFLTRPKVTDMYFSVPQYSDDPLMEFSNYNRLMEYLEKNSRIPYYLSFKGFDYDNSPWKNQFVESLDTHLSSKEIFEKHFLCKCIYTEFGKLILGISTPTQEPNIDIERFYLFELQKFSGSKKAYITYEQMPPKSENEFNDEVKIWQNQSK